MATWLIRYTASQFATLPRRVNSDTLCKASKPRELVMQPLGITSQPRGIDNEPHGNSRETAGRLRQLTWGAVQRFIERWTAVTMGQFTRGLAGEMQFTRQFTLL